jgi:membrane protease YdiL (CAAX protease family)
VAPLPFFSHFFSASFPTLISVDFDGQAIAYLAFVMVLLPIAAVRTRLFVGGEDVGKPARDGETASAEGPGRSRLLSRSVLLQVVLFGTSLFVARKHGILLWPSARVRARDLIAGVVAFAVLSLIGVLSWRIRSPEERRHMWVRHIIPRTPAQWGLWLAASAAAGVSEETTYRGVLVVLLSSATASFAVGALLSAGVFALVHYPQGTKSVALVFAIALVLQAVVSVTGALYVAMVVHALYDMLAGVRAAKRFAEVDPVTA